MLCATSLAVSSASWPDLGMLPIALAIPFASLAAAIVLAVEAALGIMLLGWLFYLHLPDLLSVAGMAVMAVSMLMFVR